MVTEIDTLMLQIETKPITDMAQMLVQRCPAVAHKQAMEEWDSRNENFPRSFRTGVTISDVTS